MGAKNAAPGDATGLAPGQIKKGNAAGQTTQGESAQTVTVNDTGKLRPHAVLERVMLTDGRSIEVARATPTRPDTPNAPVTDTPPATARPRWTGQHLELRASGANVELVERSRPYEKPAMSGLWALDALRPDPLCDHCEKPFKARAGAKTCSTRCRVAAYRKRKIGPTVRGTV